jgi:homoserine dehydrogenase
MIPTLGIGLFGCGAVGTQVARILLTEGDELARRCGVRFELRHVAVRNLAAQRDVALSPGVLCADPRQILADPHTHVAIELIGGMTAARDFIHAAIAAGKHIITANKALLALHGREIFAAARAARVCVAFEAAVGGGLPIIESVRRGLAANQIDAVVGILNGTSNYILTRMLENNASYAHALAEAQRLGFAEADPTLDVSGIDAAHKLTILAGLAMRRACDFDRVVTRGIADIQLGDLTAADELGYACKLLAIARSEPAGLDLSVQPAFIPKVHPLAAVRGPFNAVSVYGHHVGHVFFLGRGAGGGPTASAVVADLVDLAIGNAPQTFARLVDLPDRCPPPVYRSPGEAVSPFYIRLGLSDQPGGIGRIATVLGDLSISIATIVQHEPPKQPSTAAVPVIVTTHPAREAAVRDALERIARLDVVLERPVYIRVLDDVGA